MALQLLGYLDTYHCGVPAPDVAPAGLTLRPAPSSGLHNQKATAITVRNSSLVLRLVYAICLAGATYNHAMIVAAHGLAWDYGGMPAFVSSFWTALTFIDALAVILLIARPRFGIALTVAIIVCDVLVNSWVGITYGLDFASYLAQVLFMLFVLSTMRIAWRAEAGRVARPRPFKQRSP